EVVIREEEEKFHETLHRGLGVLEEAIRKTKAEKKAALPGDVTFRLYDTFGFPLDLIQVIAKENQLEIDEKEFEVRMEKQRSQSVWKRGEEGAFPESIAQKAESKKLVSRFTGYEKLKEDSPVTALFSLKGEEIQALGAGEEGFAIFET